VAGDVVELAELQVKLLRSDLKDLIQRSKLPLIVLIVGMVAGVAALPTLTFGLAQWLAQSMDLALWTSQLIVGTGILSVSILFVAIAIFRLQNVVAALNTTTSELAKNFAWLKEIIQGNGNR
jgi:uncharacterized membrane protein